MSAFSDMTRVELPMTSWGRNLHRGGGGGGGGGVERAVTVALTTGPIRSTVQVTVTASASF